MLHCETVNCFARLLSPPPVQILWGKLGYNEAAGAGQVDLLYVILDIFSRYVVGWMMAPRETAELAKRLIADTCQKQGIVPGTLTIHADRGNLDDFQAGGAVDGHAQPLHPPQPTAVWINPPIPAIATDGNLH